MAPPLAIDTPAPNGPVRYRSGLTHLAPRQGVPQLTVCPGSCPSIAPPPSTVVRQTPSAAATDTFSVVALNGMPTRMGTPRMITTASMRSRTPAVFRHASSGAIELGRVVGVGDVVGLRERERAELRRGDVARVHVLVREGDAVRIVGVREDGNRLGPRKGRGDAAREKDQGGSKNPEPKGSPHCVSVAQSCRGE